MGTELNTDRADARPTADSEPGDGFAITVVPWLDERSAGLVRTTIATIARRHPELRAAILYGSVARHEERPLDDPEPSDVDLLLIVEPWGGARRIPLEQSLAIYAAAGDALDGYLYPPRDVQVLLATPDLAGWDAAFVANVAREGILLWARAPLPAALAAIVDGE
ncbi:MAG TPA: nucleotidyltransferase domain-containing protein [Ktedonobacterales bacterium]|jgi:predicted nucleotidyltransferase|nr:nucleotidyltransferase domain-containing protein [Ktedonobacterales bacterium]